MTEPPVVPRVPLCEVPSPMSLGVIQDKLVPGNGPSVSQLNFSKVSNIFMRVQNEAGKPAAPGVPQPERLVTEYQSLAPTGSHQWGHSAFCQSALRF